MSSKRKIAANRKNAARSTGPSTADGKASASHNAYRHGLTVSVLNDPAIAAEVEQLAGAIVGRRSAPSELVQARIIAEAEFDLLRVRAMRVKMIESMAAGKSLRAAIPAEKPVQHDAATSKQSDIDDPQHALLRALPSIEILERYERRAFSRRRRAISRMYFSSI